MAALELATTGELGLSQPPPEMGWSAVRYVFAVENVVHVFAVEDVFAVDHVTRLGRY